MGKTFPCGHPKTSENTYRREARYQTDGYIRSAREMCRTCVSTRSRERYVSKPKVKQDKPLKFKSCLLARVWR